jgi:hypothetical protein
MADDERSADVFEALRYRSKTWVDTQPPPVLPRNSSAGMNPPPPPLKSPDVLEELELPAVFKLQCVQCDAGFTTIVYKGPHGRMVATLPEHAGGISSKHAPPGVAYYLDQAARAHSVGADTAAITMFRSAAEWLLYEQGYDAGMLGTKVQKLEVDIKSGTAPDWANKAVDVLDTLRELGNTATHTNAGDLTKQSHFDSAFYSRVQAAFVYLLEIVYEAPSRHEQMLAALRQPLRPKPETL